MTLVSSDTGQSKIAGTSAQQFASVDEAAKKLVTLSQDALLDARFQGNALQVRERFLPASFIVAVQSSSQGMLPHQAHQANI